MIYPNEKGIGTVPTSSIISSGVSTAGGLIAASGLLTTIGLTASFIPFVGPIIGGIALAIGALGIGNGCGQTCVVASQDADKIEPLMKQNLAAARAQAAANGGELTQAEQTAALQNFNDLWGALVNACSDPNLKTAGKNCIGDRQRGGKYDWFSYYYDPITAIPVQASTTVSSVVNSIGSGGSVWLVGGAAVVLLALLFSGGGDKR